MTYLVCSLTYHNNNTISITEITDYRDIRPANENKHGNGAQTWGRNRKVTRNKDRAFILKQTYFSVNNDIH
jgi:hypothetical protein